MGWEIEIPDVVTGEPVESDWGNQIRDQLVHVIPLAASLPTDVTDGAVAYTEDTDQLWMRRAGVWLPQGLALGLLAIGTRTSDVTGIGGSLTDIPGLSVVPTIGTNRRIRIYVQIATITATVVGDRFQLTIFEGGAAQNMTIRRIIAAANAEDGFSLEAVITTSPGPHTYKGSIQRIAGTGTATLNASATSPAYITVEDIGPV